MHNLPFTSPFQSLDLGVIGNSVVAALVDKKANIVWHCAKALDGDPTFCALLKGSHANDFGYFSLRLKDQTEARQHYLEHSAILETQLYDAYGGAVSVFDFCPCYSWGAGKTIRPPVLMRIVRPLKGTPEIALRFRPAENRGEKEIKPSIEDGILTYKAARAEYQLLSNVPPPQITGEEYFKIEQELTFLFGCEEDLRDLTPLMGEFLFTQTEKYWQDWTRSLRLPPRWQEDITRAAITLKLCTYAPTGGIVAALTTSIPEHAFSQRNWDYRYCWVRDSLFTVTALEKLGATETRERYINYLENVLSRTRICSLQPLFGIAYDEWAQEEISPYLEGYRDMGPVRFGNGAFAQMQNDTYGNILLSVRAHFLDEGARHKKDKDFFDLLEGLCEEALSIWENPDSGIWEYRTFALIHTHSAAFCWKACAVLAEIATSLKLEDKAALWEGHAKKIYNEIWRRAWSEERQSFVDSFEGDQVDASLLLLPEIGFIEASHPRFKSTLKAIEKDLKKGSGLLRYAHQDDFGTMKSTFNICSFWYAQALFRVGRHDEAQALFEELLKRRNHLGMMSEDSDPLTGEPWGNYPQTYSQAAIIETALLLSGKKENEEKRI